MPRPVDAKRMTPWAVAAAVALLALAITGCGDDDFANRARPPAPIIVSAAIGPQRVSVSPAGFGAGVIDLIVTNETGASQRVTLRSRDLASGGRRLRQSTGPINPGDTASLQADLDEGTYALATDKGSIDAATIDVGARRAGGQDRLLQP